MGWAAIAGSWASVVVSLLVGAFVYGKLSQRVTDNSEDIRDIRQDVRAVQGGLQAHETRLQLLEKHR